MSKKFGLLFFITTLLCAVSSALANSDLNAKNAEKEYRFTINGTSKKTLATATLKLSEKLNLVYLYFEGARLQSGVYKIFKTENCAILAKQIRSKKSLKDEDELYSFETKYGNISGEKNLSFKSFQELGIGHIAFALVKIERKKKAIASCTQ